MSDTNQPANDLQQHFMDYLTEEGFRPDLDTEGDIHFKCEGHHYYILFNHKDRLFVRLFCPPFWKIESEEEQQKALEAAQYATRRCKVCKVCTNGENVCATIEMFVAEPAHATAIFPRAIAALQYGVSCFVSKMRGEGE